MIHNFIISDIFILFSICMNSQGRLVFTQTVSNSFPTNILSYYVHHKWINSENNENPGPLPPGFSQRPPKIYFFIDIILNAYLITRQSQDTNVHHQEFYRVSVSSGIQISRYRVFKSKVFGLDHHEMGIYSIHEIFLVTVINREQLKRFL